MPPKKKVTFNLNPAVPPLPRRNRAASIRNVRTSLQGIAPPPPPPPPPPLPPLPRRNRGRNVAPPPPPRRNRGIAPPPPRLPRPRPLRRSTGMKDLTKIPKQKGGAFTREMGKKLFLDKLTRPSRPSVTRTSKPRKKPKKHRDTKDVANKRMQQLQKLRNLAHPPMRAAKVSAKKKLKEHRTLRNLEKLDRARKAKVTAKKRIAQFNKLRALAGHPSKPKQKRRTQWKRLRRLDVKPRPNESAEDTMKRQLLQTARQEISHLSSQKIKALSGPTRVAKNKHFLDALQQVEEKHRKKLIKGATTEQINTISEVALNILQGNVPLKGHHKKKLNKHKKSLRALASKGVSVTKRKKIINQHGGMIGAAASALGEYTYDNIKKYNKDYNSFCTKHKLKEKIPCKFAPKDYNTAEYRRKHNDNVKCTIL